MDRLDIRLMGPPIVEIDGKPINVDTSKAIALLAYLAVEGEPQRRESLAAFLWPESDASRARASLRRTLSALKKGLKDQWLEIDGDWIGLFRGENFSFDVEAFWNIRADTQEHGHPSNEVCQRCEEPLREAIALYRQDFMDGFTLRDSHNFDQWQLFQSENLRRGYEKLLDRMTLLQVKQGMYEEAITTAHQRLALDPLHEATHRLLMKLYAWSNQRAAALRQYRQCVRVLDEELKVPPLEETTEVYNNIRAGELEPSPARLPSGSVEVAEVLHEHGGGPERTPVPLIGRHAEWGALLESYRRAESQGVFILLEAEVGIGKTHLAEAFLDHLHDQGVFALSATCFEGEANLAFSPFVEALQEALLNDEMKAKLEKLQPQYMSEASRLLPQLRNLDQGLPEPLPLNSPGAQVRFFEGVRQLILSLTKGANPGVLFLDDLHFADQASLDLLTFIIRRTREDPFWVLGCIRSEDLSPDHRLRLLLAERQRMGSGSLISLEPFKPAETAQMLSSMSISEGRISEEVYERLHAETEGLPYLVDEYATAIQQALSQGREVDWSLPQSANGLLRSKLSGLSSGAMQLLTAAAVIGRPFDDEMLRQVSGRGEEETVEMLEELIGRRLLQESDPPGEEVGGRYYFHIGKLRTMIYAETSQARKRLLHRRAAESLHRQHGLAQAGQVADHYRRAGMEEEAREHYVRSGDYERSLFANKEALSHYASALDLGHPDRATLLEKMGDLYMLLGEYGESMERYEGAAAYAGNGDRSRYEHKLGLVHHRKGEWLLAERHFEAALRAMEDTDGVDEKALVLSDWALTTFKKGDSARAQDLAEQALDLASQSKDKRAIGQSHNVAGILARHQGDLGKAGELFEVSLKMAQEMEDEGAIIAALNNLALVYADKGEIDKGIETIQEALARCAALGDRHREGALHNNLADLLQASGQKEAALSHIKDSVAIYAEIGVEGGEYQPEIWKLVEW